MFLFQHLLIDRPVSACYSSKHAAPPLINKSLLALKECIRALDIGRSHIPHRHPQALFANKWLVFDGEVIVVESWEVAPRQAAAARANFPPAFATSHSNLLTVPGCDECMFTPGGMRLVHTPGRRQSDGWLDTFLVSAIRWGLAVRLGRVGAHPGAARRRSAARSSRRC